MTTHDVVAGGGYAILLGAAGLVVRLVLGYWKKRSEQLAAYAGQPSQDIVDANVSSEIVLNQLRELGHQNERLQKRNNELDEKLTEKNKLITRLQGEVASLQHQLSSMQIKLNRLEKDIGGL